MVRLVLMDIDGVVTNGKVFIDESGKESKSLDFKDIDAIFEMKRMGLHIGFVTGEDTRITEYFGRRFTPDFFYKGRKDKRQVIKEIEIEAGFTKEEICFIGDGRNDVDAVGYVGMGACPADAIEDVKRNSKIILSAKGGEGCLHELVTILKSTDCSMTSTLDKSISEHIDVFKKMLLNASLKDRLIEVAELIVRVYEGGNKLLICGNGESAADAQRLAAELVGRFSLKSDFLNVEALLLSTPTLTFVGNNCSLDKILEQQMRAKGNSSDVLMGISTGILSTNVILAAKAAQKLSMKSILFTGAEYPPEVNGLFDMIIDVPCRMTPGIQEAHLFIYHWMCEYIEKKIFCC